METEKLFQEMHTTMASINAYLAILVEEVENKKKKVEKKKNNKNNIKKRNIYTKKKDGTIAPAEDVIKGLPETVIFFYTNMAAKYPSICMMDKTLLYDEYCKLCDKYGTEKVNMKIEVLDNYAHINSLVSTYKTLNIWLKKDKK